MKYEKLFVISLLLAAPIFAFAHGEEVLFTFFIPIIPGIIFLIVLNALQLNTKSKGILFTVYAASVFLSLFITDGWPYRDNEVLINLIFAFGPPLIAFVAYLIIKRRERNLKRKEIKSFLTTDLDMQEH